MELTVKKIIKTEIDAEEFEEKWASVLENTEGTIIVTVKETGGVSFVKGETWNLSKLESQEKLK